MNESIYQLVATCSTLVIIGITISKLFFKRIDMIETTFVDSIRKINENLNRVDKSLAVNTALVDQILKRGYNNAE
jgi:hypothetical protein